MDETYNAAVAEKKSFRWPRFRAKHIAGLASIALLASGAISVFTETNGLGSAALLASGLVAGLASFGYRARTFLLSNGEEGDLETEIARKYESGDEEGAAALAVESAKEAHRGAGIFGHSARSYEEAVRALIAAAIPASVPMSQAVSPASSAFDFIFYGRREGLLNIAVDVRGGSKFNADLLTGRYASAMAAGVLDIDAIAVVVRTSPDDPQLEAVQTRLRERLNALLRMSTEKVRLIGWRTEDPALPLVNVILGLMAPN